MLMMLITVRGNMEMSFLLNGILRYFNTNLQYVNDSVSCSGAQSSLWRKGYMLHIVIDSYFNFSATLVCVCVCVWACTRACACVCVVGKSVWHIMWPWLCWSMTVDNHVSVNWWVGGSDIEWSVRRGTHAHTHTHTPTHAYRHTRIYIYTCMHSSRKCFN